MEILVEGKKDEVMREELETKKLFPSYPSLLALT